MNRRQIYPMLGLLLILAGCGTSHNWNRKITVVVDTPSGEVSASSVQWESISDQSGWWVPPEARGAKRHFRGEAVVVELGQHRYLFALLGKPDTFAVLRPGEAPLLVAERLANLHGAKALPRSEYPTFITFTDVHDPKSVKEVKPERMSDALGSGFGLKSITFEITDEPVTKGKVECVLGWLANEDDISAFWKSLYAGGFRPNGSIEVKTLFLK